MEHTESSDFEVFQSSEEEPKQEFTDQDLLIMELDQNIIDMKIEIINVLRDLRKDSGYETVHFVMDRLYALASNADGTVHLLKGDGTKGYVDSSVKIGMHIH